MRLKMVMLLSSLTIRRERRISLSVEPLVSIEQALGAPILRVIHQKDIIHAYEFEPMMACEPLPAPEP